MLQNCISNVVVPYLYHGGVRLPCSIGDHTFGMPRRPISMYAYGISPPIQRRHRCVYLCVAERDCDVYLCFAEVTVWRTVSVRTL